MGRYYSNLNDHEKIWSLRWFWASVWIYYLALWSVKLSILFQYLRILPFQRYRSACYALMAIVTLWTLWAFFSAVFACTPIDHFWDPAVEGTCLNRLVVWYVSPALLRLSEAGLTSEQVYQRWREHHYRHCYRNPAASCAESAAAAGKAEVHSHIRLWAWWSLMLDVNTSAAVAVCHLQIDRCKLGQSSGCNILQHGGEHRHHLLGKRCHITLVGVR